MQGQDVDVVIASCGVVGDALFEFGLLVVGEGAFDQCGEQFAQAVVEWWR